MFYEPKDGPQDMAVDPFKNLVVPRPIGWVTSLDREGRVNLAPFSFFNAMSEDPPTVAFSP
ncbi:MAG TPA: flavin reductase family protein, partial [Dongiaceae bacterium]